MKDKQQLMEGIEFISNSNPKPESVRNWCKAYDNYYNTDWGTNKLTKIEDGTATQQDMDGFWVIVFGTRKQLLDEQAG
jgi:hypothetical protein